MSGGLPIEVTGVLPNVDNTTILAVTVTDAPVESVTSANTPLNRDTLSTSMETGANYTAVIHTGIPAPRGMEGVPTGYPYTEARNLPQESYYKPARQRLSYDDTNVCLLYTSDAADE